MFPIFVYGVIMFYALFLHHIKLTMEKIIIIHKFILTMHIYSGTFQKYIYNIFYYIFTVNACY